VINKVSKCQALKDSVLRAVKLVPGRMIQVGRQHVCPALRAMRSATTWIWTGIQLKRRGQYPVHRVQALRVFSASTPLWQIVAVIVLTPVPSLLVITSFELVPLNPPIDGLAANRSFFAREFATFCVIIGCLAHQVCAVAGPALPISSRRLLGISLCIGAVGTITTYALASTIGFPIPFTAQVCAPIHLGMMTMGLFHAWRPYLRADPSLGRHVSRSIMMFVFQASMIFIYPIYYYIFTLLPDTSTPRAAFLCLLPVLKVINRLLAFRVTQKADDEESEDVPVRVVLNADVMGCLFTTFCMQYKPSTLIAGAFALVKTLQALLMFRELRIETSKITKLRERIHQHPQRRSMSQGFKIFDLVATPRILDEVVTIYARAQGCKLPALVCSNDEPTSSPGYWLEGIRRWLNASRVTPVFCIPNTIDTSVNSNKDTHDAKLECLEREYGDQMKKLLFMTEFMILVEYIEVIIPALYCTYCWLGICRDNLRCECCVLCLFVSLPALYLLIMSRMPSRVYYPQFTSLDAANLSQTVVNVLLYTVVKLESLVLLHMSLLRMLRVSSLHQLAFVLTQKATYIQLMLIAWGVYSTQASLDHYGTSAGHSMAPLANTNTARMLPRQRLLVSIRVVVERDDEDRDKLAATLSRIETESTRPVCSDTASSSFNTSVHRLSANYQWWNLNPSCNKMMRTRVHTSATSNAAPQEGLGTT